MSYKYKHKINIPGLFHSHLCVCVLGFVLLLFFVVVCLFGVFVFFVF